MLNNSYNQYFKILLAIPAKTAVAKTPKINTETSPTVASPFSNGKKPPTPVPVNVNWDKLKK